MPVQLLGRVRLIVNVDDDLFAFFEAEQWSGELTVVGSGNPGRSNPGGNGKGDGGAGDGNGNP
jgi:hypothetical protein